MARDSEFVRLKLDAAPRDPEVSEPPARMVNDHNTFVRLRDSEKHLVSWPRRSGRVDDAQTGAREPSH